MYWRTVNDIIHMSIQSILYSQKNWYIMCARQAGLHWGLHPEESPPEDGEMEQAGDLGRPARVPAQLRGPGWVITSCRLLAWAGCNDCGVECWRLPSLDTWLPVFFLLASNNLYHASRVRVPLRERNVLVFIRTLKLYIVPGWTYAKQPVIVKSLRRTFVWSFN